MSSLSVILEDFLLCHESSQNKYRISKTRERMQLKSDNNSDLTLKIQIEPHMLCLWVCKRFFHYSIKILRLNTGFSKQMNECNRMSLLKINQKFEIPIEG